MDLSNLTKSERLAGLGGVVLLVASFLPWYGFGGLGGFALIGWSSGFLAWGGIVAGIAGVAVLLSPKLAGKEFSAGPLAGPQLAATLTGLATAMILLRILTTLSFVAVGVFAGLAGAAIAGIGSLRAMKEAGMELPVDEIRERFAQPGSREVEGEGE